ncbi:MAG: RNA polymerase sigma factor [Thermomicrobiales bacterium]
MVATDHDHDHQNRHHPIIESHAGFSETVAAERDWLVRWFLPRCGGQESLAEDLTQETLIEAWRIRARFVTRERGARPWLAAIARNVLLRWQRATGGSRLDPLDPETLADTLPDADDTLDPVWFSEQHELRDALGRALETVAPGSRDLLVRRYLREESIAEIALAEGLTAAHVGVRLQRARNAVRTAIDELFAADFADDLMALAPTVTNATRMWCPDCGSARLIKTVWRDGSSYALRCPRCTSPEEGSYAWGWFRPPGYINGGTAGDGAIITASLSARELLDRTFGVLWSRMQQDSVVRCPRCSAPVVTRSTDGFDLPEPDRHIQWWCPQCGDLHQSGNLTSAAMNHPRGNAFWRDEGQIRTEPLQKATVGNQDAILITLAAVQRTASITFAYTPDATRLLLIDERA